MYHGMYQRVPAHPSYRMRPRHQLPRHCYPPYVRHQGVQVEPQPPSKRRKIELSNEDKRFLKSFQERVGARRKESAKQTVAQTLEKLGNLYKTLEKCKDNLGDVDVARKLEESSAQVTKICTKQNMTHLKKLIAQRQKKKVSNAEQRNAKIAALALEIDHWRATMLAQDKKKKEDEELCSTAGNTLQQVLHKQKQTKRLLDTVKLLVDLREIRKQQSARRHGTFVEPEVDLRFDRNVSKIKEVIKEKLETFYAEEKTIKVLMEANEADIWGVEKKLRQLEHIPDDVIDYSSVYLEIQYNPRKLVEIRRKWDEYLCTPITPAGSRVPTTTLLPPSNPTPQWGQYLRAEGSHHQTESHQPQPSASVSHHLTEPHQPQPSASVSHHLTDSHQPQPSTSVSHHLSESHQPQPSASVSHHLTEPHQPQPSASVSHHLTDSHQPQPSTSVSHHLTDSHQPQPSASVSHHLTESHLPQPSASVSHHLTESHLPQPSASVSHHLTDSHQPQPSTSVSHHLSESHQPQPSASVSHHLTDTHQPQPSASVSHHLTEYQQPQPSASVSHHDESYQSEDTT